MALSPRPSRAARLSAAVEKAFGEVFYIEAYTPSGDVNGRHVPDATRVAFSVIATWRGPSKSFTPKGRGSASDDRAHNWTATLPSVNVEDVKLAWPIQMGDKITRALDGSTYQAGAPYQDGYGRTTVPLNSKQRGWATVAPSLDFSVADNSQYVPLI